MARQTITIADKNVTYADNPCVAFPWGYVSKDSKHSVWLKRRALAEQYARENHEHPEGFYITQFFVAVP